MTNVVFQAFGDELQKIAGELQGYTRIGRKPISIERMLSNEEQITGLPNEFVGEHMTQAAKALVKMSEPGEKTAAVGLDDIPGYFVGRHYGRKQRKRGEKHSFQGKQFGSLFLPGGVGYQAGRYAGHHEKKAAARGSSAKTLALLAAGGGGALVGRQANEDRKLGRMIRRQQQGQ